MGDPKKRQFGAGILSVFKILQHGKRVRGTCLAPFSYTDERRAERSLINQYESDVAMVLERLTGENVESAKMLLNVPSQIRGFDVVKQSAMSEADVSRKAALKSFSRVLDKAVSSAAA